MYKLELELDGFEVELIGEALQSIINSNNLGILKAMVRYKDDAKTEKSYTEWYEANSKYVQSVIDKINKGITVSE